MGQGTHMRLLSLVRRQSKDVPHVTSGHTHAAPLTREKAVQRCDTQGTSRLRHVFLRVTSLREPGRQIRRSLLADRLINRLRDISIRASSSTLEVAFAAR